MPSWSGRREHGEEEGWRQTKLRLWSAFGGRLGGYAGRRCSSLEGFGPSTLCLARDTYFWAQGRRIGYWPLSSGGFWAGKWTWRWQRPPGASGLPCCCSEIAWAGRSHRMATVSALWQASAAAGWHLTSTWGRRCSTGRPSANFAGNMKVLSHYGLASLICWARVGGFGPGWCPAWYYLLKLQMSCEGLAVAGHLLTSGFAPAWWARFGVGSSWIGFWHIWHRIVGPCSAFSPVQLLTALPSARCWWRRGSRLWTSRLCGGHNQAACENFGSLCFDLAFQSCFDFHLCWHFCCWYIQREACWDSCSNRSRKLEETILSHLLAAWRRWLSEPHPGVRSR